MRKLLAACLVLAGLSLLLPSEPSYDPWAWLVWGREILSLDLDTRGGPSWKPLPVGFTLLFAPFGELHDGLPPAFWLVVARASGLLALALAFRVARRLAGSGRWTGAVAGGIAAITLLLTPQWLRYMAHGNEAPMAVALMLWAVERHLDRARGDALLLGFLACLVRPEALPFLVLYGAWLWRAEPARRRLVAGLLPALAVLWLGPEWIGSGDPLGAGQQARSEPPWSLSHAQRPWLEALERGHRLAGLPLELGALAAVALAPGSCRRAVLSLAGAAALWLSLVVAMTEAGFSGNPRYFLPALVIVCVLAGVGVAGVAGAAASGAGRLGSRLAAEPRGRAGRVAPSFGVAASFVLVALAWAPWIERRIEGLERQAVLADHVAQLQHDLGSAVRQVGGRQGVTPRGAPTVNRPFATRLAWELSLPLREVELGRGRAVVFLSRSRAALPPAVERRGYGGRLLARVGEWEVLLKAPQTLATNPAFAGFSHSMQP